MSDIDVWLEGQRWRFASTMPHMPHWYTLRKEVESDEEFVRAVLHMRERGERRRFGARTYVYYRLNGFDYWTMGAAIDRTTLINRARVRLENQFSLVATKYDEVYADEKFVREDAHVAGLLRDIIISGGSPTVAPAVLDVGCGTGWTLDNIHAGSLLTYLGIDACSEMLDVARGKHPAMDFRDVSFEDFLPTRRFDLIVSLFGSPSYLRAGWAPAIRRMLRPGGCAFLMFYRDDYVPKTGAEEINRRALAECAPAQARVLFGKYDLVLIKDGEEKR